MKKTNKRYGGETRWLRRNNFRQRQQRQPFHRGLDCTRARDAAGRAKIRSGLCGMGSCPGLALFCRIPQNVRANYVVVQFQDEKYVQLHQDSYPGDESAL